MYAAWVLGQASKIVDRKFTAMQTGAQQHTRSAASSNRKWDKPRKSILS
jgi:hypothetical protein